MAAAQPPRFVTPTMTTTFVSAIPTLRMDDNRYDTAAASVARKSALVAFGRT